MSNDPSHAEWQPSIGSDAQAKSPDQTESAAAAAGKTAAPGASSASSWGKKTVLLVDVNPRRRESRARVMRELGATVHCASTRLAARSQLELGSYSLVLLDFGGDVDGAEQLARDIRTRNPRQLVAFLVGSPRFVATTLAGKPASRPTPSVVPVRKAKTPTASDFGQQIRDAEAKQAGS